MRCADIMPRRRHTIRATCLTAPQVEPLHPHRVFEAAQAIVVERGFIEKQRAQLVQFLAVGRCTDGRAVLPPRRLGLGCEMDVISTAFAAEAFEGIFHILAAGTIQKNGGDVIRCQGFFQQSGARRHAHTLFKNGLKTDQT